MNVEIGAEAALFPEKDYINGIAVQCGEVVLIGDRPRILKLLRAPGIDSSGLKSIPLWN
jgi:hypothetical protein